MSVISIETAAMSKSRLAKGFNGDSINLNRRISSVDEMNNGYRAAGKIAPPCVCAVASSCIKGVSVGAVTAFDDYSHSIYKLRSDAESEMKRYTDDMSAVASDCGEAHLSLSSVCIFGDKILASSVGGGKVFVCSSDGVREISSDDGSFAFSDLSDLSDGGFIVILGAECAHFADSELIGIVTSQSKNIKAVSKALFTSLNKVAPDADITGVFFKITASAAEPAVPVITEADSGSENAAEPEPVPAEPEQSEAESEKTEPDEDDIFAEFDDDEEEDEKKQLSAGKKLIGLVPFIVLAALVGIALAVYVFTGPKKDDLIKTTTPSSDINANAEVTEPVTEPDNNNSDPETTTAGETTAAQTTAATTDNGRNTTRSGNSNTTRRNNNNNNTTTQRPTAPPTTQKPTQPPTAPPTTQKPTQPPTTQKPTQPPTTQPTTRITDQGNDKPFG